ncbi:MAG: sugar phosphate isomerase/epimerase family protein [Armatimonadota bacterium]|jgi:sugar phosphate isomerase/epimerase
MPADMKLSLDTYVICKEMSLEHILKVLADCGYDAVEFRCEHDQQHGVELEASADERTQLRKQIEDAGIAVSCLSTSRRFEWPEPERRQEEIDLSKRYVELARDMGCGRIRTFGNNFPDGVEKQDVVRYVGESLRQIGEFAEGTGVDVMLEMHGEFNHWEYALGSVTIADHPNVAINYNCDRRDLVDGSVAETYGHVKDHIRHVHMHDLADGTFPYVELFQLLEDNGYRGYMSLEQGYKGGDPDTVIKLYAALYRALMAQVN